VSLQVWKFSGFWPGDESQFGTISFYGKEWTHKVDFPEEEIVELTHSHAILSSFSWLLAQACYQGITPLCLYDFF
jgi:small subunit ribosomal protein S30